MIVEQIHRSECEFIKREMEKLVPENSKETSKTILVPALGKFKPIHKKVEAFMANKKKKEEANIKNKQNDTNKNPISESLQSEEQSQTGETGGDSLH